MVLSIFLNGVFAQSYTTLKFTGKSNLTQEHIPLHYIEISNLYQHWEEGLFYPDTVLQFGSLGIGDYDRSGSFFLFQNEPNPFEGITDFILRLGHAMRVVLEIYNMEGQTIVNYTDFFSPGDHHFRVTLSSPQTCLLSAMTEDGQMSIKMINRGTGKNNKFIYLGAMPLVEDVILKKNSDKGVTPLPFILGDMMMYRGHYYSNGQDYVSQAIQQRQWESEILILPFEFGSAVVHTDSITNVGYHSATCYGNVTDDGNMNVISGMCWETSPNPTIEGSCILSGCGIGGFVCNLTELLQNTTYYVRSYAINDLDTVYGEELVFTTLQFSVPNVTTANPTGVSFNTAVCGGTVNNDGGSAVSARGVCWGTTHNPDITGETTNNGIGLGSFTSNLTNLTPGTTYYVRAYATNSIGTEYGNEMSFITSQTMDVPSVTTNSVTNISNTVATCGGNVTSIGGSPVTARGVCWSTSQNPTVSNSHTTNGSGMGGFTSNITGLSVGTTYFVRAYAINSAGIGYGNEVSFSTPVPDGSSCLGIATITDRDGNTYNTVKVGNQCWMKQNLRTTKYADGTSIEQGSSASSNIAYWYYPNNNPSNKPTYGLLYNWKAVIRNYSSSNNNPSGVQGVCPTGWHVPSYAEWDQLENYVSNQNQYLCNNTGTNIAKALAGTMSWSSSDNTCAVGNSITSNNATGFSALPAGSYAGTYFGFGEHAFFWSSTQYSISSKYFRYVNYARSYVTNDHDANYRGGSVRCLKD